MALSSLMQWEVRSDGSDSNGGGFKAGASGTDRSQQAAAHATLTAANSTVHTTTTQIAVGAGDYTVTAADVGNVLQITGGTATAGYYEITAADTVNNRWTVDRSAGTAGQTVAGKMGGAMASIGSVGAIVVAQNRVWLKAGTTPSETLTTSTPGKAGPLTIGALRVYFESYTTTRGDKTGFWIVDAGVVTGISIVTVSNVQDVVEGIKVDGKSGTGNNGFNFNNTSGTNAVRCWAVNCNASTTTYGFGNISNNSNNKVIQCYASSCGLGFSGLGLFFSCVAIGCSDVGFKSYSVCHKCVAHANSGDGFEPTAYGISSHCVADANSGHGFDISGYSFTIGCIASNHTAVGKYGFNNASAYYSYTLACYAYNNTNNFVNTDFASATTVNSPYQDQASDDFRPNATAAAGLLLRAAGIGVYGQTENTDAGAVQHSDPAGGSSGARLVGPSALVG